MFSRLSLLGLTRRVDGHRGDLGDDVRSSLERLPTMRHRRSMTHHGRATAAVGPQGEDVFAVGKDGRLEANRNFRNAEM